MLCNYLQNVAAITYIFVLQLSTFLFYNKHIMYDYLHSKLYTFSVLQADETTVFVNKDGRPAGSKSYMWLYRTVESVQKEQILLYEYQKTRNSNHPRTFLKSFHGICITDGYQVYHRTGRSSNCRMLGTRKTPIR